MATTPSEMKIRDPMPTLPERGYSGTAIKARIIQAMELQMEGERRCMTALDRLLTALGKAQTVPPPPAPPDGGPPNGAGRRPLDSTVH